MSYIVHLTGDTVLKQDKYQGWMQSFGSQCLHLIANGSGEALPLTDGIYTQNKMFNELCPELFPAIFLQDFVGTITQVNFKKRAMINYSFFRKWNLRRQTLFMSSIFRSFQCVQQRRLFSMNCLRLLSKSPSWLTASERTTRFRKQSKRSKKVNFLLNRRFKNLFLEAAKLDLSGSPYPSVTFLGTGSAIPIKYRNVSGHLLQLNAETSVLIDCGEGTYGQLRSLYGPEKIDDELTKLSAIFITHAHLDHIGGIKTFIRRRIEAFERKGL